MLLTTIFATATISTISGTVLYLISKDDKRRFKESLHAYLNHYNLNYSYNYHDESFVMTPTAFEAVTKVKVKESNSIISCSLYLAILDDLVPIYSFEYDKRIQRMYNVKKEYFVYSYKNKEINELIQEFNLFILTGKWKSKINHGEHAQVKVQVQPKKQVKLQMEADPDIHHHLQEIERKIDWLKNTEMLEIEEAHKIDVLQEDAHKVLNVYRSFRDETKLAFKEKLVEALHEISVKLNELSIQKEEQLVSDIDKTITLIKKR